MRCKHGDRLKQSLGFEIDARVIAFGIRLGARSRCLGGYGQELTGDQVFSVLWPPRLPGTGPAPRALPAIRSRRRCSIRLLVVAARDENLEHIDVTRSDWQARYAGVLESRGVVVLTAPADQASALSRALRAVPALPVDRDVLRVYGEVLEVLRAGSEVRATIHIQEALQ